MTSSSDRTVSRRQPEAAVENAPLVVRVGRDGSILSASAACARLFGCTPRALVGASFLSLFSGTARRRLRTFLGSPAQGRALAIDHSVGSPPQRVRWTLARVAGGHGGADDALAVGCSVTAERGSEAVDRRSARWFDDFFANLRDGFAAVDLDGRIVEFNPAFVAITGFPPEELLTLTYEDLTPERWHTMEREVIEKEVLTRGYSRLYEKEYRRRDGSTVPVELRTYLWRGTGGEEVGLWAFVRDVAERKRAEQALRESEERYRELVENINEILFTLDRRGNIDFMSPVIETIAGVRPGEVIGRHFSNFLAADDLAPAMSLFERAKTGEPIAGDFRILTAGGAPRWFRVSIRPIRDGERLAGLRGLLTDIHERRLAEQALRESQQYLSSVMSLVADPIITVRMPERIIEYASRAVEDIFGHRSADLIGQSTRIFYPDDESFATFARHVEGALERGERHLRVEQELACADGRRIWAELTTTLLFADERLVETINVIRDVTERRRMEEALRRSEATKRAILAAMPDLTFLLGRDGTFLEFLSGDPEKLARPPDEFLGRSIAEILPPELARETIARVAQACSTGELQNYEYDLPVPDGPRRFDARMVSLGSDAALAVVRDVTERRTMEEQLQQAQKMEAIGRLAGGAAHDFNNLLQAMLSHLELLRAARGDVDRLDSTAAELEKQIHRGAALTRQLLLFSRRDTARKEMADVNEVVLAATGLLRRLVRENIGFHLALASDPLPAELDRGQIEQVLMNLVVNASDAMPDGGRLTISTSACAPGSVSFSVSDTGCGIAQELRDRIFDPFFTTKAPDAGTGLGLSVVHGIVARHGGTIDVESTVGGGSTFRIGLPRADRPTGEARAAAGRTTGDLPGGRGERVLLVEDEDAARQALEQTIAMLGYEVVAADSGAAVMRLADGPACDLVLTDLLLPDAFGADLADALRSRWPGVRVLLMSGYATDDQIRHSVETGRVRFLQKPFDMAALARELRAALDEGQPPLS